MTNIDSKIKAIASKLRCKVKNTIFLIILFWFIFLIYLVIICLKIIMYLIITKLIEISVVFNDG